jgi:hypothetical protein
MYDLRVRRGPEGRGLNVSPARKGWDMEGDDAACPGVPWERRRCGTVPRCCQPDFDIPCRTTTMSNEINATQSTIPPIWTASRPYGVCVVGSVGGNRTVAPCSPQRTWDEKDGRSPTIAFRP